MRAETAAAYEAGVMQRVVIIEFDSVEKAIAAHDIADAYQAAVKFIAGVARSGFAHCRGNRVVNFSLLGLMARASSLHCDGMCRV